MTDKEQKDIGDTSINEGNPGDRDTKDPDDQDGRQNGKEDQPPGKNKRYSNKTETEADDAIREDPEPDGGNEDNIEAKPFLPKHPDDQDGIQKGKGDQSSSKDESNCRNIMIAICTTLAAIIFSLLIGAWSKVAFDEQQTKVTFIVLIIIAGFGTLALFALYRDICNNTKERDKDNDQDRSENENNANHCHFCERIFLLDHDRSDKKSSIWKIKLGFLFTFAVGYLTHCGWYLARGALCAEGMESTLRIIYNTISSVFTFLHLLYLFIHKNINFIFKHRSQIIAFAVIFQNICIWLDAVLSESAGIFDKNDTLKNKNISNCSNDDVGFFIENVDTFLTPMMIEYSLLAVQMLYTIAKGADLHHRNEGVEVELKIKEERCCSIFIFSLSLLFFCFIAAFFMFTIYVTFLGSGDSMALFVTYISFQLVSKTCMLLFLAMILINILCINGKKTKCHPLDVGKVSLLFSGFGNVLNCMFDLYAVTSLGDQSKILSFTHSVICICLVCIQNVVLFMIPKKYSRLMQCLYPQLAILNFGLWACGSIGEIRDHTFTEIQYQYYKKTMWMINTKLFLSVSIFYRFHCAIEFLELWVESSNFLQRKDETMVKAPIQNQE